MVWEGLKFALVENHVRLQLGKIISFKQSFSNGKTSHGKQYSESLAAAHGQKYASLIHCWFCFNPITIQDLNSHYKNILYTLTTSIPGCKSKEPIKAVMIILSVLAASMERSMTCRPIELTKSLLLQMRHCQRRPARTVQSQNVIIWDNVHPLCSELGFYL